MGSQPEMHRLSIQNSTMVEITILLYLYSRK